MPPLYLSLDALLLLNPGPQLSTGKLTWDGFEADDGDSRPATDRPRGYTQAQYPTLTLPLAFLIDATRLALMRLDDWRYP